MLRPCTTATLKQGSGSLCDDGLYHRAAGWFNSLRGAAMLRPATTTGPTAIDPPTAASTRASASAAVAHSRTCHGNTADSLARAGRKARARTTMLQTLSSLSTFLAAAPRAGARRRSVRQLERAPSCADPAQAADFALLSSALDGLLAKWPARVTLREFPVATKARRALQIQSRTGAPAQLPAQLLSDLCHEIAEHVEPAARSAAVRCLRRCAACRATRRARGRAAEHGL